jgi:hypothetical protein
MRVRTRRAIVDMGIGHAYERYYIELWHLGNLLIRDHSTEAVAGNDSEILSESESENHHVQYITRVALSNACITGSLEAVDE